jgi:drug/metabolite transporter (DMT)-like permease
MTEVANKEHTRAVLMGLFVTVLWASSWVMIRWGLDDEGLSPLVFAGIRYLLASILLAALVAGSVKLRAEIRSLDRARWAGLGLLGMMLVAVAQGAQFVAIDTQPAATTSLILSLTPLIVAGASTVALSERPAVRQVVGVCLIVLGAVAYFSGELGFTVVGLTASIVGLLANSGGTILGRGLNRRRDISAVVVTVVSMGVGALALTATGLLVEGIPSIAPSAWLIIIWLAVVNTALAFTLWNRSLQHLSATESAAINSTMLILIGLLAWLFLDETPGPLDIFGIAAVTLGVYLAQAGRATRERTDE